MVRRRISLIAGRQRLVSARRNKRVKTNYIPFATIPVTVPWATTAEMNPSTKR